MSGSMAHAPLEVLFATQGALGTAVMGLGTAASAFRRGLERHPEVHARFVAVGDRNRWSTSAIRSFKGFTKYDLDLFNLRFHVSESIRGRALLERELRRRPADVVHVTSHTLGLLPGRAARRSTLVLNVDVALWEWAEMGHWRTVRPWTRATMVGDGLLERRAFERANLVIAWSEWSSEGVRRRCPQALVEVIHPGLDTGVFRPFGHRASGPFRLLFVGGRLANKGGLDLLEAAAPLLADGRVELDLVTPAEVEAPSGVRVHRLAPGAPELVELYRQADAFVLPSWGDAVPWVVLEAMACATPVIGSRVGAIPEMLDGERAGLLVPPRDPRTLRRAIEALIADPDRARAMGAHGRQLVCERYEVERQTGLLVAALRAAVARHRFAT